MKQIYQALLDKNRNIVSLVSSNVEHEGYVALAEAAYSKIQHKFGIKFKLLENGEVEEQEVMAQLTLASSLTISARQLRLWLLSNGLLSKVEPLIDKLSEQDRAAAKIEWEYATSFAHDHKFIQLIGAALGFSESAIVSSFREAALL